MVEPSPSCSIPSQGGCTHWGVDHHSTSHPRQAGKPPVTQLKGKTGCFPAPETSDWPRWALGNGDTDRAMTGLKGFVMYSMIKSLVVYLAFYCTKLEREHNLIQALIPRAGLPSQTKSTTSLVRQVLPLQIFLVVIKTCNNQLCAFATVPWFQASAEAGYPQKTQGKASSSWCRKNGVLSLHPLQHPAGKIPALSYQQLLWNFGVFWFVCLSSSLQSLRPVLGAKTPGAPFRVRCLKH